MSFHSIEDGELLDFESDDEVPHHGRPNDTVNLSTLPSLTSLPTSVGTMTPLGPDYQGPGSMDVICGRGKQTRLHSGNRKLRTTIESKLEAYSNASSKLAKSTIVSEILDGVRDDSPGGGFVKLENEAWFEVGDHMAREKIGQTFRDLLHMKYRSSTKAKVRRKKANSPHDNEPEETAPGQNSNLSIMIHQHLLSESMNVNPTNQSSADSTLAPNDNDDDLITELTAHATSSSAAQAPPIQPGYSHPFNSDEARCGDEINPSSKYSGMFDVADCRELFYGLQTTSAALLLPDTEILRNEHPIDLKHDTNGLKRSSSHVTTSNCLNRSSSHDAIDLKRSSSHETHDLKRSGSHETNDLKRSGSYETDDMKRSRSH